MDNDLLLEAIKIVKELNEQYLEVEESSIGLTPFVIDTNGYDFRIKYMNICIYFSDEDERDFCENSKEYEPLKNFILKELQSIMLVLDGGFDYVKNLCKDN